MINYIELNKGLNSKNLIPQEVKDKVNLIIIEPSEKEYHNKPFEGIVSDVYFINQDSDFSIIQKSIIENMNKKEIDLINKIPGKVNLIRRKISYEIAELINGTSEKEPMYRLITAGLVEEQGLKIVYPVFGYESVIIEEIK